MGVVVNFEDEKKGESALARLQKLVKDDMDKVNQTILHKMQSPVALIPQLAGHLIASGGKRLRPMLTIASSRLCGYEGDRHVELSACVEFIHSATLLHDDVVDESDLRRGRDTANAVWGNKASVLVGDFLFSRSFELMVADGSLEVLRILSHASSVIAEGEVLQLTTANDTDTTEDSYMEVIAAKTAALFAAACEIGAVIAERPTAEQEALQSYGKNLGIIFQLVDDVLDYSAEQEKLGKSVGDDFREGKITLPIVLAFRRGTDEERAFWRRTMEELEQQDGDLEKALDLINKHNALNDTLERARHYGAIARDALAIFPDNEHRQALTDIVDFCIARAY
ncbi:polyprenyl synthetase family protein [Emcibacter nanhaiensis]|uniref:Octaprenyl diphosphate synthase n=1 Tax=Emcibacter nanhaiensis TaxID=1505037 RepID=A0A501PBQ2_9PROT|nr:polyprenyl synthetase family protein [Emcibacter nanhaiensis]TPD57477.1 polyprenyl synthetase family protein [Emcibacter nanhaiensis]